MPAEKRKITREIIHIKEIEDLEIPMDDYGTKLRLKPRTFFILGIVSTIIVFIILDHLSSENIKVLSNIIELVSNVF